jgi:hypothetical protein
MIRTIDRRFHAGRLGVDAGCADFARTADPLNDASDTQSLDPYIRW